MARDGINRSSITAGRHLTNFNLIKPCRILLKLAVVPIGDLNDDGSVKISHRSDGLLRFLDRLGPTARRHWRRTDYSVRDGLWRCVWFYDIHCERWANSPVFLILGDVGA